MTAHIDTPSSFAGAPPTQAVVRHTAIFLPLFAPFGISSGYVSVTLAFLLGRAGLSALEITTIIAATIWVQTWKILWAPIVDTVGNPKLWYGLGAVGVGGTILAMSVLPATAQQVPLITVLAVISSAASTLVSMSSEIFLAQCVPAPTQGRASGWSQAGNLGGAGLGGGLGLLLAEHVSQAWVSGGVLAIICVACWGCLYFVPAAMRTHSAPSYFDELKGVATDVWEVARSRVGYLALILMVLPIASGAAPWSAIAGEWNAGADLVAWVNGVAGGLAAAAGAMVGGYLCDRMSPGRAYCVFGMGAGAVAVVMAWSARTPTSFVVFTMAYSAVVGCGYAAYSAIVLQAIGQRSAATNFNLMSALANVPIAVMTSFDGWVHDRFGTNAMLYGELALPAATIAAFVVFTWLTRPREPAGTVRT
ncbi:MFS transporter [Caenimonas koreensis]|uniref:MFS transporter n=1 Tax=Caenimonas koreensis TaxID=367474 RepID=UPI0037839059